MNLYQIWIDGKLISEMENVNLHQQKLDFWHSKGMEPIEKKVKHNGN